ncbi:sugar phosphate nucleotidyltransferase, partial [Gillisia sp. Q332]
VSAEGRLLGTLTDGDVRRSLLVGGSLDTRAVDAMNKDPVWVDVGTPDSIIIDRMRRANIQSVPVVDAEGRYVDLVHVTDLGGDAAEMHGASGFAAAVIMAGGEGRRLRPLTDTIPKPMVEIDGIPLLERLVRRLASAGVERVYISVNYLSHLIEGHLRDGSHLGTHIVYLRETDK